MDKPTFTVQEEEVLTITQEECSEVIGVISKIKRFGTDSNYNGLTNKQRLEQEVGDLFCMIDLLADKGFIELDQVYNHATEKREKLREWSKIFDTLI